MYHSFAHHILINSCTHICIYIHIRVTKPHTLTRVEFFICTLVSLFETPGSRYVYIMKCRNLWSFGDREKQQKDMRRNDMKRFSTELCRGEKDIQLRPSIHKAQAKNSQALDVHSVALQNKSSPPKNEWQGYSLHMNWDMDYIYPALSQVRSKITPVAPFQNWILGRINEWYDKAPSKLALVYCVCEVHSGRAQYMFSARRLRCTRCLTLHMCIYIYDM